jgi:hypothetical protein
MHARYASGSHRAADGILPVGPQSVGDPGAPSIDGADYDEAWPTPAASRAVVAAALDSESDGFQQARSADGGDVRSRRGSDGALQPPPMSLSGPAPTLPPAAAAAVPPGYAAYPYVVTPGFEYGVPYSEAQWRYGGFALALGRANSCDVTSASPPCRSVRSTASSACTPVPCCRRRPHSAADRAVHPTASVLLPGGMRRARAALAAVTSVCEQGAAPADSQLEQSQQQSPQMQQQQQQQQQQGQSPPGPWQSVRMGSMQQQVSRDEVGLFVFHVPNTCTEEKLREVSACCPPFSA